MIKFTINTQKLLKILQKITPLLIKNNTSSILQNILIQLNKEHLLLIASNLETEVVIKTHVNHYYDSGKITVSGKKLLNICKVLANESIIKIKLKNDHTLRISTEFSYFKLLTLPPENYPKLCSFINKIEFTISQQQLKTIIKKTYFCMANNDIRFYLNGILLDINNNILKIVATDGHRIAFYNVLLQQQHNKCSIIISRSSIIEIIRLLNENSKLVTILINNNNFRIKDEKTIFTTKLINGSFPDYKNLIAKKFDITLKINCLNLKHALQRVSILSDKKFKSVHFYIKNNIITLTSSNEEEETAKESINMLTQSNKKIKFTVNLIYIIDILNVVTNKCIYISLNIPVHIIKIQENINSNDHYIIMPLQF